MAASVAGFLVLTNQETSMRKFWVLGLTLVFALAAGATHAADKKGKPTDTAGKDKEMADKDKKDATGTSGTWTGPLTVKPKDAGKDVVCAMISKKKGEKEAILKLEATGDVATQIEEIRKKGVGVKVTGVLTDDTIKVSKVEEYVKMKK